MEDYNSPTLLADNRRIANDGYVVPPASDLRKRAAVACQICRDRKVKCNVTESGIPCVNCKRDGTQCDVKRRKHNVTRRSRRPAPEHTHASSTPDLPERHDGSDGRPSVISANVETAPQSIPASSISTLDFPQSFGTRLSSDHDVVGHGAQISRGCVPPEYATNKDVTQSTAIEAVLNDKPWSGGVPFFVGDHQGIGYVLDICEPDRAAHAKHYLIPQSLPTLLEPENIDFLRANGVFSLPPPEVCDELLRCYFNHIHPIMPILEADRLLNAYADGGIQRVNLLLVWCIFLVAIDYTQDEICQRAGFQTHRIMKRAVFNRAKCMYDNGREQDKIVLIQSTLLMSFWYSDTEDRTGSWHWIGVAISLAQTMGFHRNPDYSRRNHRISDRQRQLWKRIWWCCIYRDRWQSFGVGRPMRIVIEDCDVPSPSPADVLGEMTGLSSEGRKFVPDGFELLAKYWTILLELTAVLGNILASGYRPGRPLLDSVAVNSMETKLSSIMSVLTSCGKNLESSHASFYENVLQLHHSAAITALFRPYDVEGQIPSQSLTSSISQNHAKQKIREAASKANLTLDAIFIAGHTTYIGPMAIQLIVPAMHTHLLDLRSPSNLVRQIASTKLDFCMTVIEELKPLYPAATFIHDVFARSRVKIETQRSPTGSENQLASGTFGHQISPDSSPLNPNFLTTSAALPILFNDSTLFDFWDPNSIFPYSFPTASALELPSNQAIGYSEFEDTFSTMWQNK